MKNGFNEVRDVALEYYKQRRLALFVGAGVSSLSGYPLWSKIIVQMADRIHYDAKIIDKEGKKVFSSDEYLRIPQMYYDQRGKGDYLSFVHSQLGEKKEIVEIHRLLMRLRPNHILTTNYDTLLEQAANEAGLEYAVINADSRVATASTNKYILKVHGDFETDNFVLKEKDYLEYESNFKLIDNILKSIIATHLVVFIGYSLNDYNIKLILNWVKQVQKETFINPIFIHTGATPLTKTEIDYYSKMNLIVVDSNQLVSSEDAENYKKKYRSAIEVLFDPASDINWQETPTKIVDHFYKMFSPLSDVNYLCDKDIKEIVLGLQILKESKNSYLDLKYLVEAYTKRSKLSLRRKGELEFCLKRLFNSGTYIKCKSSGTYGDALYHKTHRGTDIDRTIFDVSYQCILKRIDSYSECIEDSYNKAYDLFLIGRYDDAMDVYLHLIPECYVQRRWFIYFFSQINLYYIRQTISQLNEYYNKEMKKSFGNKYGKLWSDERIERMKLSHLVTDIPVEIKEYGFLKRLTDVNCYKDSYVLLCRDSFKIDTRIAKGECFPDDLEGCISIKTKMLDTVNFTYDNRIVFSRHLEHKNYIKLSLREHYKYLLYKSNLPSSKKSVYISFQELLLIIRSFGSKELDAFLKFEVENKLKLKSSDLNKYYSYLSDLIDYFFEQFSGDLNRDKFIELIVLKNEIDNALLVASYYVTDDELIKKCLDYIYGNDKEFIRTDLSNCINMLEMFMNNAENRNLIIPYIEDAIISEFQLCDDKSLIVQSAKTVIGAYVSKMAEWFPNYKNKRIEECLAIYKGSLSDELYSYISKII